MGGPPAVTAPGADAAGEALGAVATPTGEPPGALCAGGTPCKATGGSSSTSCWPGNPRPGAELAGGDADALRWPSVRASSACMAAILVGYGESLFTGGGPCFRLAVPARSGGLLGGLPGAFPIIALRLLRSSVKSAVDRPSGSDGVVASGGDDGDVTPRGRAEPSEFLAVRPVGGPACRGCEPREEPGLLRSCTSDGAASGRGGAVTPTRAGGRAALVGCGAAAVPALGS
mmetsp:Transcript_31124/g.80737  ORF Transcript_31124/g.80737 Transcript_31124/m.80737 type:complete len:230 (+) Transcript_31124:324-1013(+)